MGQNEAATPEAPVDPELKSLIRDRIRAMRQKLRDKQAAPENKRRGTRHAFLHTQRITPHAGSLPPSTVPSSATFFEVQCQDISTTGFSFRSARAPGFTQLIVELGVAPDCVYISARIVRTLQSDDGSYLIGCEFLGRINVAKKADSE